MIRSVRSASRRLIDPFVDSFKKAPVEFMIAALATFWASMMLREHPYFEEHGPEVLVACGLSFVAALILSALHRFGGISQRERFIATALLCGLFAAMSGLVLDLSLSTNYWRVGLLIGALACVLPLCPLARSSGSDESMGVWRFTLNLTSRIIVGLAYAFAMLAATSIALLAIGELFPIHIESRDYGQVAIVLFLAFVPGFLAGGLDEMATESAIADTLSLSMLERAGKWLVAPTLAVYLLIIYTYTAKVALTGEAPANVLSPLALGAASLGLAAIFFFEPMASRDEPDWFSHFVRWLPLGLLAGLPLATWAIGQRVEQHGWTEFRYLRLLLVAGFALTFVVTPLLRRHREQFVLRIGPAVFGLLFVLASIGPFSASKVSRTSQLEHLRAELHQADLDLRGELSQDALTDIPRALKRSITSRLRYLETSHGPHSFAHLIGNQSVGEVIASVNGYEPAAVPHKIGQRVYAKANSPAPITITRPSRIVGATTFQGGSQQEKGWTFALSDTDVELVIDGQRLSADLDALLTRMQSEIETQEPGFEIPEDVRTTPIVDASGEVQGMLYMRSVELGRSSGEWSISTVDVAASIYE